MLRFVAPTIWLVAGACLAIIAAANGIIPFVLVVAAIALAWGLLQVAKASSRPNLDKPNKLT